MSLQKINKLKDEKGFTIVELLIVIVVIGILAAITIVAFNGVQQRARDTSAKADASSIVKVAEAYNAREASTGYPTASNQFTKATTPDLDAVLPTGVSAGTVQASATVPTAAAVTTAGKAYLWYPCPTAAGVRVYFLKGTTVDSLVAGTCS